MSRDYIGYINFIMENEIKLIVFDLEGCTTLKIGKPLRSTTGYASHR